jgi:hypothetical protein
MANQGGASYQWVDCDNGNAPIGGATGQTFVPSVTGNYAVEVTVGGCTETSGCESITVVGCNNPDVPAIAGTLTICAGDNIILSVGASNLNDATSWEWYTGSCGGTSVGSGASLMVSPTVTTTYFVRGEGGCVIPGACASITLAVQTVDASVTNNGTSLMANQGGASYQWVDCGDGFAPIFAETGQTYVPSTTGNYAVEVTLNGCTETSSCQLVDFSGLDDLGPGVLIIYPNPTEGIVYVEWTESISKIQVMDARGRLLDVVENPMGNLYTLNFTDYSSGVYFIQIENTLGTSVYDVMKQ